MHLAKICLKIRHYSPRNCQGFANSPRNSLKDRKKKNKNNFVKSLSVWEMVVYLQYEKTTKQSK